MLVKRLQVEVEFSPEVMTALRDEPPFQCYLADGVDWNRLADHWLSIEIDDYVGSDLDL